MSTDPQEIKAARSVIKGKLTSASNSFGGLNDLEEKSSKDRFERLMKFLVKYKTIVENRSPDVRSSSSKTFTSYVTGNTFTARVDNKRFQEELLKPSYRKAVIKPCLACDDGATSKVSILHRLDDCEVWTSLSLAQKKAKAQCVKHPWTRDHTTANCTFKSACCSVPKLSKLPPSMDTFIPTRIRLLPRCL